MKEVLQPRRSTREVKVGEIGIGGANLVRVQSMITEETSSIDSATQQIIDLREAGAEIVRVTVPTMKDVEHLGQIRGQLASKYGDVPLVADVHHQGSRIATEVTRYADKVRINPGNFVYRKPTGQIDYSPLEIEEQLEQQDTALKPLIEACKERGVALRLGVNHGSLAERLTVMYGDTPEGMVESALEYIRLCEARDFQDIVVSLKASRVPLMIQANRLMVNRMEEEGMNYPMHLGVTEAGKDSYARVKSSIGIGTLLSEGIGDTIRTSLTEDPVNEIEVCFDMLQAVGLRRTKAEFISCPGCGRTKFDLPSVTDRVNAATKHLNHLAIGVMGCIVNGPGEMADADYGYVGKGGGKIALYKGREEIAIVSQDDAIPSLIDLIKENGDWTEPLEQTSTSPSAVLNKRPTF